MKHFGKRILRLLAILLVLYILSFIGAVGFNQIDLVSNIDAFITLMLPLYLIFMIISEIVYRKKHKEKRQKEHVNAKEPSPSSDGSTVVSSIKAEKPQRSNAANATQGNPQSTSHQRSVAVNQASSVEPEPSKATPAYQADINSSSLNEEYAKINKALETILRDEPSPMSSEHHHSRQRKTGSSSSNITIHHLRRKLYNFVVVDTETTGLSVEHDRVIQLAAIRYQHDKPVDTFKTYVNPGSTPLSSKVTAITGITDEQLKDAPTFDEIKDKFLVFAGTLPWVGHNINRFDIPLLINNGLDLQEVSTIDTLKLARKKLNMEHYGLANLKDYFGIQNHSHDALEDCKTTVTVYRNLRDDNLSPVQADYSSVPQSLAGLNFAISGTFPGYSRKDIETLVISHGGKVKSSVTHNTDYLIDGKQTSEVLTDGLHSGKELKAREYGIKVLSLPEFRSLLER